MCFNKISACILVDATSFFLLTFIESPNGCSTIEKWQASSPLGGRPSFRPKQNGKKQKTKTGLYKQINFTYLPSNIHFCVMWQSVLNMDEIRLVFCFTVLYVGKNFICSNPKFVEKALALGIITCKYLKHGNISSFYCIPQKSNPTLCFTETILGRDQPSRITYVIWDEFEHFSKLSCYLGLLKNHKWMC